MGFGSHKVPLLRALMKAFPGQDALEELSFYLDVNLEEIGSRHNSIKTQTMRFIWWAETQGRERDLVERAVELNSGNEELAAVVANIRRDLPESAFSAPWYEPPDPIETCFVRGGWAFMDRLELRQALQRLTTEGGPRSLVVEGPRRTGRSYTLQLIQHVAACRGHEVIDVDLSQLGIGLKPNDLMVQVALQMRLDGGTLPPRRGESIEQWNMAFRSWLLGQVEPPTLLAEEAPVTPVWWLVIDGMDLFPPSDDAMDLIWKLVDLAEHRAPHLRVALLANEDDMPASVGDLVVYEYLGPVDRGIVESYFELFFAHKGIPVAADAVEAAVSEAIRLAGESRELADANGDDDLRNLSRAVASVAKRLGGAPAGL